MADDYAASTSTTGVLAIGDSITGTVEVAYDHDWFKVSLTAGTQYQFDLKGLNGGSGTLLDPYLSLYSNSSTLIAFNDDVSYVNYNLNSQITYTAATTGTYYLAAQAYGSVVGTYTLSATSLSAVAPATTTPVKISVGNGQVAEGASGTTKVVVPITLDKAASGRVTVKWATQDNTAFFGLDYTQASGTVTFATGQTSALITLSVLGDAVYEPDETFSIVLNTPSSNATIATGTGTVTLRNDDAYVAPAFTDPLYLDQWYLENSGQNGGTVGVDLNVVTALAQYRGTGIRVGVLDTGIEAAHPDLVGAVDTAAGWDAYRLVASGEPVYTDDNHGTAVAGLIAARANGTGMVGVAPEATLVSLRMDFYAATDGTQTAEGFKRALVADLDVLNNSWGWTSPFDDNFNKSGFTSAASALRDLAVLGRDGLGMNVVFAAGNSYAEGDNTNYHNFQNSRYVITVGSINNKGTYGSISGSTTDATGFSTPGSSVFVAAAGDNVLSTDRTGTSGYSPTDYVINQLNSTSTTTTPNSNRVGLDGTSFAAPEVAGVIALMLQANPNLGNRDVQDILAATAIKNHATDTGWVTNGAKTLNGGGYHVNDSYGFGLVNATAAVRLAETWTGQATTANETVRTYSNSQAATIGDLTTTTRTITVTEDMRLDWVEVDLNMTHTWAGDLEVYLTSPTGVVSRLIYHPGADPTGTTSRGTGTSGYGTSTDFVPMTLTTNHNWNESPVGTWTLTIKDTDAGLTGSLTSWTLRLTGDAASNDTKYIYTDEFATLGSSSALNDTVGADSLNAASVTSDSYINLQPGSFETLIAGRSLQIAAGTVIESAYGGDGNDVMIANDAGDYLFGGRGNDTITGGAGADTILSGTGYDTIDGAGGIDTVYLTPGVGTTSVINVEVVIGSSGSDYLTFRDPVGDNIVNLLGGNDYVSFGAGVTNSTLFHTETVAGGSAGDSILFTRSLTGGAFNLLGGNDSVSLQGVGNVATIMWTETVLGSSGNDHLIMPRGARNSSIDLQDGSDTLDFTGGVEVNGTIRNVESVLGSDAADLVRYYGTGTIAGGLGADVITLGGGGSQAVRYGSVNDGAAAGAVTGADEIYGATALLASLRIGDSLLGLIDNSGAGTVGELDVAVAATGGVNFAQAELVEMGVSAGLVAGRDLAAYAAAIGDVSAGTNAGRSTGLVALLDGTDAALLYVADSNGSGTVGMDEIRLLGIFHGAGSSFLV